MDLANLRNGTCRWAEALPRFQMVVREIFVGRGITDVGVALDTLLVEFGASEGQLRRESYVHFAPAWTVTVGGIVLFSADDCQYLYDQTSSSRERALESWRSVTAAVRGGEFVIEDGAVTDRCGLRLTCSGGLVIESAHDATASGVEGEFWRVNDERSGVHLVAELTGLELELLNDERRRGPGPNGAHGGGTVECPL